MGIFPLDLGQPENWENGDPLHKNSLLYSFLIPRCLQSEFTSDSVFVIFQLFHMPGKLVCEQKLSMQLREGPALPVGLERGFVVQLWGTQPAGGCKAQLWRPPVSQREHGILKAKGTHSILLSWTVMKSTFYVLESCAC